MIYSDCGGYTAITIYANNEYDALIQVYSFTGGDGKLTSSEMKLLFKNSEFQRACEIFHSLSGVKLAWLSEVHDSFVNKLDSIAEYYGTKIDCSTCKNNVEYPPPHTCDICTSLDEHMYCMWEAKGGDVNAST